MTSYPVTLFLCASLITGVTLVLVEGHCVRFVFIATPVGFIAGYSVDGLIKKPLAILERFGN